MRPCFIRATLLPFDIQFNLYLRFENSNGFGCRTLDARYSKNKTDKHCVRIRAKEIANLKGLFFMKCICSSERKREKNWRSKKILFPLLKFKTESLIIFSSFLVSHSLLLLLAFYSICLDTKQSSVRIVLDMHSNKLSRWTCVLFWAIGSRFDAFCSLSFSRSELPRAQSNRCCFLFLTKYQNKRKKQRKTVCFDLSACMGLTIIISCTITIRRGSKMRVDQTL